MSWEDWDDYAERRKNVDRKIRAVSEAVDAYEADWSDWSWKLTKKGEAHAADGGMTPDQYRVSLLVAIGEALIDFLNNEGEGVKQVLERGSIWKD